MPHGLIISINMSIFKKLIPCMYVLVKQLCYAHKHTECINIVIYFTVGSNCLERIKKNSFPQIHIISNIQNRKKNTKRDVSIANEKHTLPVFPLHIMILWDHSGDIPCQLYYVTYFLSGILTDFFLWPLYSQLWKLFKMLTSTLHSGDKNLHSSSCISSVLDYSEWKEK